MTGREPDHGTAEHMSEYLSSGRRYRLREYPSGPPLVERWEVDGWELLDDDAAAAVVDRLRRGEPGTGQ